MNNYTDLIKELAELAANDFNAPAERKAMQLAAQAITDLKELVKIGELVVEDFMPNIGNCALQDYGRLNDFLIATSQLKD